MIEWIQILLENLLKVTPKVEQISKNKRSVSIAIACLIPKKHFNSLYIGHLIESRT